VNPEFTTFLNCKDGYTARVLLAVVAPLQKKGIVAVPPL